MQLRDARLVDAKQKCDFLHCEVFVVIERQNKPLFLRQLFDRVGEQPGLLLELTAIEATLETWISQIRENPAVTAEMMHELRMVTGDIVSIASHIVAIDEETCDRLD